MTHPNRSNSTHPDAEQERREQARHDGEFARGQRDSRPDFTRLHKLTLDENGVAVPEPEESEDKPKAKRKAPTKTAAKKESSNA